MIYSLVRLHPVKSIALDGAIRPQNIPVFVVLVGAFDSVHFGDSAHHGIMALAHIDEKPAPSVFGFVPFFLTYKHGVSALIGRALLCFCATSLIFKHLGVFFGLR